MKKINCVFLLMVIMCIAILYARVCDKEEQIARLESELSEVRGEREDLRDRLTDVELSYDKLSHEYYREIYAHITYSRQAEMLKEEEEEEEILFDYDLLSSLEEVNLLARCCSAEAGSTNYESQKGIAQVILNRVENERYPNSIEEVIYQDGQFGVVKNGAINKSASEETLYNVINVILYGYDFPSDVLSFRAERAGSKNAYTCIQGTAFYENSW